MEREKILNNLLFSLILFSLIIFQIQQYTINLYLVIIISAYIISKVFNKRIFIKSLDNFEKIFLVLILYSLIISLFHENNSNSFIKNLLNLRFLILIIIIKQVFNTLTKLKLYLFVSFILFCFLLFDIFYQYIYEIDILGYGINPNHGRLNAYFDDEYVAGSFITKFFIINLLILNFIKFQYANIYVKNILLILFIFITGACIFLTGERTAFGEFVLFFIFYFIFLIFSKNNFNSLLYIGLGISLLILLIYILRNEIRILERYFQIYDHFSDSKSGYLALYLTAIEIIKNNLLFGVGNDGFENLCIDYNVSNLIGEGCSSHAHNYLIDYMVENGIVGSLILIYLIYYIFRFFYKNTVSNSFEFINTKALIISLILIYFFPLKPSNSIFSSTYGTWIWFNIGILFSICKIRNQNHIFFKSKSNS